MPRLILPVMNRAMAVGGSTINRCIINAKFNAAAASVPDSVSIVTTAKWYVPAPDGTDGTADVKKVAATRMVAIITGCTSIPSPIPSTHPATPSNSQCAIFTPSDSHSRAGSSLSAVNP